MSLERLAKYLIFGIVIFFAAVSIYNISLYGPTTDEPAHLGAAYAYSKGMAANVEHPPLMKVLNSFLFSSLYPNVKSNFTEQYTIGWDILASENGRTILILSRLVYLMGFIFSLSFILVLSHKKILPWDYSLVLIAIAGTSPLLLSHAGLVTFDVMAGMSALNTLLCCYLYIVNTNKNEDRFLYYSVIGWLVIALLVKFSLVLLVLSVIMTLVVRLYKEKKSLQYIIIQLTKIFFIVLTSVWLVTWYAYRNASIGLPQDPRVPEWAQYFLNIYTHVPAVLKNLIDPLLFYISGMGRTFIRSQDVTSQFVLGSDYHGAYAGFFLSVYWYKENPLLLVVLASLLIYGIFLLFTKKIHIPFPKILPYIPLLLFMILYTVLAFKSKLLLGVRHMYPVITLMYAGIAGVVWAVFSRLEKYKQKGIAILVGCILVLNIHAATTGISYINALWPKEKWLVAGDSTFVWGQDVASSLVYVHQSSYLRPENAQEWSLNVSWYTLEIPMYARYLGWGAEYASYKFTNVPGAAAFHQLLIDPHIKYILIDAQWLQYLSNHGFERPIQDLSKAGFSLEKNFRNTVYFFKK